MTLSVWGENYGWLVNALGDATVESMWHNVMILQELPSPHLVSELVRTIRKPARLPTSLILFNLAYRSLFRNCGTLPSPLRFAVTFQD